VLPSGKYQIQNYSVSFINADDSKDKYHNHQSQHQQLLFL